MKILFQGDSITDGNRYKLPEQRWDKNHQIGHTWVYIVTGELMYRYPGKFECINRGVSSNTLLDLKARWQEDAVDIAPDVMVILIGANDCGAILNGKMTVDDYESLYRELISRVKAVSPELKTIILEPFTLRDNPDEIRTMKQLSEKAHRVADDVSGIFIPLQDDFTKLEARDGKGYWVWDGIHPTEAGHCMIAHKVLDMAAGVFSIGGTEN